MKVKDLAGTRRSLRTLLVLWLAPVLPAGAHPGHSETEPPAQIIRVSSPARSQVEIVIEGNYRVIRANGLSDQAGEFPNRNNPNRIAPQRYTFRMPLKPAAAATATPIHHDLFGVALNGVPFDPGTAEFWNNDRRSDWNYEALSGFLDLGLDRNNAHVQPNGAYHYHASPSDLVRASGVDGKKMLLIGWAADGFPIYSGYGPTEPQNANSPLKKLRSSWRLKSGVRPGGPGGKYDGRFTRDYEYAAGSGDLDECNGHFGATPECPQGTYHYHITDEFPHVPRFWRGTPDPSFEKRRPGPRPPGPPI